MDYLNPTELLDRLDDIIRTMELDENGFYVAIEVAHQLRDEIDQALTECGIVA